MPTFRTRFYDRSSGCEFTVNWPDHREYLLGKAFLDDLTGGSIPSAEPGPDFYILETKAQCDAMLEFRKSLRAKSR